MNGLLLVMLLGALACTSCSSSSSGADNADAAAAPATLAGSCNNAGSGFCNEFTGSGYTAAGVEKDCNALGAGIVFLPAACPTDSRVGTCLVRKGTSTESYYRYYANFPGGGTATPTSAAAAGEKQCTGTLKGGWTPN